MTLQSTGASTPPLHGGLGVSCWEGSPPVTSLDSCSSLGQVLGALVEGRPGRSSEARPGLLLEGSSE